MSVSDDDKDAVYAMHVERLRLRGDMPWPERMAFYREVAEAVDHPMAGIGLADALDRISELETENAALTDRLNDMDAAAIRKSSATYVEAQEREALRAEVETLQAAYNEIVDDVLKRMAEARTLEMRLMASRSARKQLEERLREAAPGTLIKAYEVLAADLRDMTDRYHEQVGRLPHDRSIAHARGVALGLERALLAADRSEVVRELEVARAKIGPRPTQPGGKVVDIAAARRRKVGG